MLNAIYGAASGLQTFCEERGWRFCFIGGLAVQRWGEPRQTQDADITLMTGFGGEAAFVDALLAKFTPRREDAREFALRYRVLLVRDASGVPLDIALGALPFEDAAVSRSSLWEATPGCLIRTCSAEDLIIHKAFAARHIDWADVERIILRQGRRLDTKLIFRELTPLAELKEQPEIPGQLRQIFDRCA